MRSEFLAFAPPSIGEAEIAEVVATLLGGWLTTGERTHRFEDEFRQYVGADAALALSSATAAMHVALAALGVGEGDAVVSTTMTLPRPSTSSSTSVRSRCWSTSSRTP